VVFADNGSPFETCRLVGSGVDSNPAGIAPVPDAATIPIMTEATITLDSTPVFLRCNTFEGNDQPSATVGGQIIAIQVGTITFSE
jgi:hypothetical protein